MKKTRPRKNRPSPQQATSSPLSVQTSAREKPKVKILLVDDHPIVRERLAELINLESDLLVCGEADDSHSALRAVESLYPDLAIIDITLKDTYGIELIRQLRERHPELPVLVLSMHDESLYGERALRAGARGYLNKQDATKKVIPAIRQVLAGNIFAGEKLSALIMQKVAGGGNSSGGSPVDVLSDRELEVFQLLGQGQTVKQIAENLFVSVKTVEAHREHIKQKMKLKSSAELLRYAMDFMMRAG
jgi:DNA-binding NarL/FixJ family response regulator